MAQPASVWTALLFSNVRTAGLFPGIWTQDLVSGCGFLTEMSALALLALTLSAPALLQDGQCLGQMTVALCSLLPSTHTPLRCYDPYF